MSWKNNLSGEFVISFRKARYRLSWSAISQILIAVGLFAALFTVPDEGSAQEIAPDGRIRVQLAPFQQTTLSTEIAANISKLPLREGQSFVKGEQLIEFDCSLLVAQLHKAEAAAESARAALKSYTRLAELNSISNLEVEQAAAKVKEAEAELAATRVLVSKCSLVAPFKGRIAKLQVDAYQYVTPGKPLMDILDTSRLEVRMIVPSRWLTWLRAGGQFTVRIEELGRSYSARIVRLGARIDPLSQTIPLTGEIVGKHEELLSGMSGTANFGRTQK
jgi:RND family efflux transporter MFP subunit